MKLKVRGKIVIISAVIFSLAMGANTLVNTIIFTTEYSDALQSKALATAQALKSQLDRLLQPDIPVDELVGFEEQCRELLIRHKEISYAMVADRSGRILFHNDPTMHGRISPGPVMPEDISDSESVLRVYDEDGERHYDMVIPVSESSGHMIATVRIGFPVKLITEKTERMIAYSVEVTLLFLVLAIILMVALFNVWVTKPLSQLTAVTQRIAEGDLSARATISSKDELQSLADAFNRMTESLKRSREELISAGDYTDNIIRSMSDALLVISPDGTIERVNTSLCTLLKYDTDELIGHHLGKVIPAFQEVSPEKFETFEKQLKELVLMPAFRETKFAELMEKGVVTNLDVYYHDRNGEKIPMSLMGSAMKDKMGNLSGAVLVARDMRPTRHLITELRAARKFSESIITTIPSGLATLDEEGCILSANPAFMKLFGKHAPTGKCLKDLLPSGKLKKAIRRVIREWGAIRNIEISQVARKGKPDLTFNISVVSLIVTEDSDEKLPLPYGENEYRAKVLVVFDDHTERKRLMTELERHIEELRRTQAQLVQSGKLTAVGELAAGVAHEMNNPLTGVLTYSILLKEKLESAPESVRCRFPEFPDQLDLIKTAAERCKAIADNLLSFSRQSEVEMIRLDISDVISKTFDLIRVQLRHKRISLILEVQENIPQLVGSSNQLQQVFTNIILNAVWEMGRGGELTVRATHQGRDCEVSISDTGPGISSENLGRIFDPFFTTKPVGRGTGLGLSIAYGIIQRHSGEISVNSELGQGTTFYIRLPVS